METYIEQMIKKKRSKWDILLVLGLSLGSTALAAFLFSLTTKIRGIGGMLFLLIAGIFYFAYTFAVSRNIEYEYSMVNHEIDIDKIANQKKRKRLTVLNVKKMESFGRASASSDYSKLISDVSVKKIYACEDKNSDDTFFAVYFEDGIKKMLLFTPCQDIVDMIVRFNPRGQFEL